LLERALRIQTVLALVLVAAGCRGSDGGGGLPGLMPDWGKASVLGGGGVLTYAFTVDPADLEQLEATATQELYVPAQLTVSGMAVGTVGLRYKGAAGTLDACFDQGVRICPKVSFKAKFDHVEPGKKFGDLKRLNFHSMLDEPSLMHERLNSYLFNAMKIITPRVSHGFITVNGQPQGLFAVVEDIDGRFTEDRWGQAGNGNLYKDAWPVGLEPDDYLGTLQTNEAMPDHTRMVAFAQGLATAPPGEAPRVLDRFANLEYLMSYMAVDQAILNYDGVTTFYCDNQGRNCSNHNFFWYQSQTEERFWLIPWDLGISLALRNPFEVLPTWDRPPADCTQRTAVEGGVVMPSGCDPLFKALNAAGRPGYSAALDRLLRVWDVTALGNLVDDWTAEIQNAVALDPYGPGTVAWRGAVRSLKRDLLAMRERIERLRDQAAIETFALPAPGLADFEGLSALSVLMGMTSEQNPHSGAVHSLNTSNAIVGGADLKLDFELANDSESPRESANLQFVTWRVPVQGPGDLSQSTQIKLRMRADSIRTVRIELDSAAYPDMDTPRYGWDVLVPRQAMELTLVLSNAKLAGGGTQGAVPLDEVRKQVRALVLTPEPRGRGENGLFARGKTDAGFLEMDNVEID
jgi:spore coat protein H